MKHISQAINKTTPSMILLREKNCEGCGYLVKVFEMPLAGGPDKGKKVEVTPRGNENGVDYGCRCEDIRLAQEVLADRQRKKLVKMQEVFNKHSLINKQLEQATFKNYEPSNDSQDKTKRTAERYVEIFDVEEPRNLLLYGTYGVGKSHLAKAIADGVIEKGFSAIFISVPKLLTKFRTSYAKDSDFTEGDIIEALNRTHLLILDDLGAEKQSEWALEKLFEIIDSRQGMHTVYTSNFTPNDLILKLGERNFSRVVNRDTVSVEIQGNNFRLENFA